MLFLQPHTPDSGKWSFAFRFLNIPDDDLYADADITKVTEVKNGWEVNLSAADSRHCDDYTWQYKWYVGYFYGEICVL